MRIILDTNDEFFESKIKIIKMIRRCTNKFYKSEEFDDKYKEIFKGIETLIVVNPKLISAYATANFVEGKHNRIDHFIITLSLEYFSFDRKTKYDIISHEVAHCIDFVIRGDSFHDNFWRLIHKEMGGTGERLI